jgi:hypothetical protein
VQENNAVGEANVCQPRGRLSGKLAGRETRGRPRTLERRSPEQGPRGWIGCEAVRGAAPAQLQSASLRAPGASPHLSCCYLISTKMRPGGPRPSIIGPDSGPEAPFPLRMKGKVVSGFGRGSKDVRPLT